VAAARAGVPVGASAATLDALRRLPPLPFYRRYTWGAATPLGDLALEPFEDDSLALVAAPGHSPDHHVVWDAGSGTLFGGDLFLGVRVRIAHHAEEPRRLVESLRAAAALRPARLFDAHRGPVADPTSALTAKADWLDETIAAIDRRVTAGWSDAAIRREVLGREEVTGYFSLGEYSRTNLVRAVRASGRSEA
jgi:glyoxylase-like metal-dependent hydrolase (beta-lactamase superfamily II)